MKTYTLLLLLLVSLTVVSAATFIEPLDMRTWFVDILSGSSIIFTAIAVLSIFSLAGFFRMNMLTTGFMIGVFFAMFATTVDQSIYYLILAVGSIAAGYTLNKIIKR